MEVKVTKNGWDILSSGYLIVANGEFVDFAIDSRIFRLTFETVENANPRVGVNVVKEPNGYEYMAIKCQNFDNSLFRTVSEPLSLAEKDGRAIALQLSTASIFNKTEVEGEQRTIESKLLFYCWCIESAKKEKHSG